MSEAWPLVPLGEILTQRKQFVLIDDTQTYRRCRVQLHAKGVVLRDVVPGAEIKTKQQQVCRTGEFLVAEIDAKVGGFGIVPDELAGAVVSSHYFLFEIDENRIDRRWLHYMIQTPQFRDQVNAQGSTNYAAVRPRDVASYRVPLPPLTEQQRIVARIEELAGKIERAQGLRIKANAETDRVLAGPLNQVFGNPYSGEARSIPLNLFHRLGDVADDVADGPHVTPQYVEEGVPFVTVLNITSGRVNFNGLKYITEEDHRLYQRRSRVERGDVLISKDGTIGIPCFVDTDREFSFFVSVALIKPRRGLLDGEFLVWVLRSPYLHERIVARSRGDMIRHLVLREIRDLKVPVPSIEEQRGIVAHLEEFKAKIDAVKELQARTQAELDAFLPSVLDRAFRGEL